MNASFAQSREKGNSKRPRIDARDPTTWRWPLFPNHFAIYDKYSDTTVSLPANAEQWQVPVRGCIANFVFGKERQGRLQRGLIMLTQSDAAPSTICKFARLILNDWNLYLEMLIGGPLLIQRLWSGRSFDLYTAWAGKAILRLACSSSVGTWQPKYIPFIKGLDCKARQVVFQQRSKVARREPVLSIETQAALIRVLDEGANTVGLTDVELEGLVALALIVQHGVRPVQALSLRLEHVRLFEDASGSAACVISFHQAKLRDGEADQLLRQMKPEWVGLMAQLFSHAGDCCRGRLFSPTTSGLLWIRVRTSCMRFGVRINFTANALRHTAAQSLADAGHSRFSIQKFLGHRRLSAAYDYVNASRLQVEPINAALGASKLYNGIISLASKRFVSVKDMECASDDQQIGAVVGSRLVAGVGLCKSGQAACPYNPVTSCYGCPKFMPSLDRASHEEAIAGMREQVLLFVRQGGTAESSAYLQLTRALGGAQQALEVVDREYRRER